MKLKVEFTSMFVLPLIFALFQTMLKGKYVVTRLSNTSGKSYISLCEHMCVYAYHM